MHVLHYHQHFSTPEGATGTRSYEVARRLLARGHAVTVVCGSSAVSVSGLVGPYRKGQRSGLVDGIRVIELALPYSNYDGFLKRSFTFIKYAFRSVKLALRLDYDLVYASSTPLTVALPGIAARWMRRKPFVFEVRDLWPELPRAMGVVTNPVVLGGLSLLEWTAYRSAHACIGLAPGISQGIMGRGVAEQNVATIPNGCDLDLFVADPSQPLPDLPGVPADAFVAAFVGAHGLANGLDRVLDVAVELRQRQRDDIRLVFIGDGRLKPELQARVHREGLTHCHFLAPLPKYAITQLLCRRVDLGLMILANVPAFYHGTSPNKFFDYLASGLPVLVNYPGWMAEIVQEHGVGTAVPPDNATAFADAICAMADGRVELAAMGRRARLLAESKFARDALVERLIALLEKVAEHSPGVTSRASQPRRPS